MALGEGMCSHDHQEDSDPLFTVSVHIRGRQLVMAVMACPGLSDGDISCIAWHLSRGLAQLALQEGE